MLDDWKILVPRETGKWQSHSSLFQHLDWSGQRVPSFFMGFNHSQGWQCSLQIRVFGISSARSGYPVCDTVGQFFWEDGNKGKDIFTKDDIKQLYCKHKLSKIRKWGNWRCFFPISLHASSWKCQQQNHLLIPCVACLFPLGGMQRSGSFHVAGEKESCVQGTALQRINYLWAVGSNGWQVGGHCFTLFPGDITGKEIVFETFANVAVISRNIL